MLTTDGRTLELVRKAFADEAKKTEETVNYGQPHIVPDYATYQRHVGYLSGLAFLETTITQAREQAEQEAGQAPRAA